MTDDEKATRLVVMPCPPDVGEEVRRLSEFNAVDKTEFVVTAVELYMDYLCRMFPELAELPPAPLRTRRRRSGSYMVDDEDEPLLMAAEDEE